MAIDRASSTMFDLPTSWRARMIGAALARLRWFHSESPYAHRPREADICDFTFGDPREMPLPGFVSALRTWIEPRDERWFAYRTSDERARAVVARSLASSHGLGFAPEDVHMTAGAYGAMAAALATLVDPGDEVLYSVPSWFFYEAMTLQVGGVPVKVRLHGARFDLDLDALAAAITPRTRMVIVNTPHNPTGRIVPRESLVRLAEILTDASERHGRVIYLLADEPYRRLVLDGRSFHSPATHYPASLISYSYAKVLLTPGARIGYLAVSPHLPGRETVREAIVATQLTGWMFPDAVLQYAIEDFEALSNEVDLGALARKRDRMMAELGRIGYELVQPEGTFYMLVRSPLSDDVAFTELLARHHVYVMPGSICELPGWLRICLTATEAMIERSIPGFAAAFTAARGTRAG
jgi:aspartate aminotransferase